MSKIEITDKMLEAFKLKLSSPKTSFFPERFFSDNEIKEAIKHSIEASEEIQNLQSMEETNKQLIKRLTGLVEENKRLTNLLKSDFYWEEDEPENSNDDWKEFADNELNIVIELVCGVALPSSYNIFVASRYKDTIFETFKSTNYEEIQQWVDEGDKV